MHNPSRYRFFMLLTGVLVAGGIILSQVLFHQADPAGEKQKAAQEQSSPEDETIQVAPTLVNQTASLELDSSVDAVVEQVLEEKSVDTFLAAVKDGCFNFFKTLLRTLIAPNAP
jgi:hypothetical protein